MPNPNISFQGQTLILPGAYYADNVQATLPSTPGTTPPLVFVGYGYGVKPQTPTQFSDPQDLLNALRGGPASGFVPFLFQPSTQVNGAQIVTFINVGENTQSSLTLSTAGNTPLTLLTSTNYGAPSNLLQASVSSATISGKKLTLFDGFANVLQVGDNLGIPFQLAYTGTASAGISYTVSSGAALTASSFAVNSPNAGESFTALIGPGQYQTVAQLIQFLNGTGFYSATPIGDGTMPGASLDIASGVSLPAVSGGVTGFVNVTASLGSVIYWVNQYSTLATAAVSASISTYSSGQIPGNIPFTFFTGARNIPPVNNDYASGFNNALNTPGWVVFADSNSLAVQALGTQHAITASSVQQGKYRRFFTGSSLGDSIPTTITNAQALNAIQTCYAYPGITRINTFTGLVQSYGGLFWAAAAAGIAAGNIIALPLTNKSLIGNGVEVPLSVAQINQLQQAGVMVLQVPQQTGVPTIISDLTTWQIDSNPENIFSQQVACRFWLAYSLINAAAPYVGTIADVYDETRILNAIKNCLNALIYSPGNNGVISSWNPATLVLTYTGATQTAAVTVQVTLVGQNRFITIFVPIQPLNLTITTTAAA